MIEVDELYVLARRVLLDALDALGTHRDAVVHAVRAADCLQLSETSCAGRRPRRHAPQRRPRGLRAAARHRGSLTANRQPRTCSDTLRHDARACLAPCARVHVCQSSRPGSVTPAERVPGASSPTRPALGGSSRRRLENALQSAQRLKSFPLSFDGLPRSDGCLVDCL